MTKRATKKKTPSARGPAAQKLARSLEAGLAALKERTRQAETALAALRAEARKQEEELGRALEQYAEVREDDGEDDTGIDDVVDEIVTPKPDELDGADQALDDDWKLALDALSESVGELKAAIAELG